MEGVLIDSNGSIQIKSWPLVSIRMKELARASTNKSLQAVAYNKGAINIIKPIKVEEEVPFL